MPKIDTEVFIQQYLKRLKSKLSNDMHGFIKATEHALREAIAEQKAIDQSSLDDISRIFYTKLNALVENQHQRQAGKRVHWIRGRVAAAAKESFNEISQSVISPEPSAARPNLAQVIKQTAGVNDTQLFMPRDLDYSDYENDPEKSDDLKFLYFAENGTNYPKLALYLHKQHGLDPHDAVVKINQTEQALQATGKPLTPNEVLNEMKKEKKIKP